MQNPSDISSKWKGKKKIKISVQYKDGWKKASASAWNKSQYGPKYRNNFIYYIHF